MPDIFSYNSYADNCKIKVLRAVNAGAKASAEVSKATGFSSAVCGKALKSLEEKGLIKTKIKDNKKQFSPSKLKYATLGIHLTEDYAVLCIYSNFGEALCPAVLAEDFDGASYEAVLEAAENMLAQSPIPIKAIGIAFDGPAQFKDGLLTPSDCNALAKELSDAFAIPVFADRASVCGGIYYLNKSLTAQKKTLVFASAGKSIECAIFHGGKLLSGECNLAGLLGHISLNNKEERCYCGNRGCLEGYSSLSLLYDGGDVTLFGIKQSRTLDDIKAEYASKDALTVKKLENMAYNLAEGLVNVINLINPSHLVLGGDFVKIGDLMTAPLHSVIKQRVMPKSFNCLNFEVINDADEALIGAGLGAFYII